MKKRLPRKLKKAMFTKLRLFDKSLGIKCRRAIMRQVMYQRYLTKLYGTEARYFDPIDIDVQKITIDELRISNKIEELMNRHISPA